MKDVEKIIKSLSTQIDDETSVWSGGFERSPNYQNIKEFGELAITSLLDEINAEASLWWRSQLLCDLALQQGECIYFPEEIKGHHDEVRTRIMEWGLDYQTRNNL